MNLNTGDIVLIKEGLDWLPQYMIDEPPSMGDFEVFKTYIHGGEFCTVLGPVREGFVKLLSPAGVGWCKAFYLEKVQDVY